MIRKILEEEMHCGDCFYWIWNGSSFFRIGYCSAAEWQYRKEDEVACKKFVKDDGSNPLKDSSLYGSRPVFTQLKLF